MDHFEKCLLILHEAMANVTPDMEDDGSAVAATDNKGPILLYVWGPSAKALRRAMGLPIEPEQPRVYKANPGSMN